MTMREKEENHEIRSKDMEGVSSYIHAMFIYKMKM